MQLLNFRHNGHIALGIKLGDEVANLSEVGAPDTIDSLLAQGPEALKNIKHLADKAKTRIAVENISEFLSPVLNPSKTLAVGLNYADHAAEGNLEVPEFPVIFSRYPSSWVGHNQGIVHPKLCKAFDYEGEMAVIIGKAGRYISKQNALEHVAGYSIFNEGTARDYQFKTHQWTIGKIFDKSGSFGPFFVSADELPAGASGLQLQTHLNGEQLQNANTQDMIFDVATLISICSEAIELKPGDVIISGTPAGVGGAYKPPKFMKPGDVCEISIEGLGVLSNPIVAEE